MYLSEITKLVNHFIHLYLDNIQQSRYFSSINYILNKLFMNSRDTFSNNICLKTL